MPYLTNNTFANKNTAQYVCPVKERLSWTNICVNDRETSLGVILSKERLADWCNIVEWPVPSKLQDNVKTEHLNELRITGVVTFYFITEKIRNS